MTSAHHLPPEALDDWLAGVAALYGLEGEVEPTADVAVVLDVARDVAHGVARPAAPLTTFLLGLAVGRAVPAGQPVGEELARLARQVQDVALARPQEPEESE
ncbi:DUF6457 domain-containing protein [Serinibacter arcticus]|uniref:DUF6457 domain-containing protein n=1 Tax=Serinibacter arcticus TaxID=1655435 RepID=UPI0018EE9881|nr:DUF6457 domain-containing protein [Serinibacter arcticus]